jgi:hypothetical protein
MILEEFIDQQKGQQFSYKQAAEVFVKLGRVGASVSPLLSVAAKEGKVKLISNGIYQEVKKNA